MEIMEQPQPPAITVPPVPSQIYLHHTTLSPRPKLILLGDSITELGSSHAQGWVTSLVIRYNRRLDVINRGMNGYNSRWGLAALPMILEEILGPPSEILDASESLKNEESVEKNIEDAERFTCHAQSPSPDTKALLQHPQYSILIGYGANDSCLPHGGSHHSRYHVPLDEYTSNLKKMIRLVQSWNSNGNNAAVALLTPPPCDTEKQKHIRDNENVTRLYAEACLQVASDMSIPVVDLWNGLQLPTMDQQEISSSFRINEQWKIDFLSDGLHLTPMGNYRLYELVIEVLERSMVGENGQLGMGLALITLPRSYPDHSMVDATNPDRSFLDSPQNDMEGTVPSNT